MTISPAHCSEVAIGIAEGTSALTSIVMFIADLPKAKWPTVEIVVRKATAIAAPHKAVDAACLATSRTASLTTSPTGTVAHLFYYWWPEQVSWVHSV